MLRNQTKIVVVLFTLSLFGSPLYLQAQSQSRTVLDKSNLQNGKTPDSDRLPPPAPHEDIYEAGQHYQNQPADYGPVSQSQPAPYCDCASCAGKRKRPGFFTLGKCRTWFAKPTFAVEEVRYGANAGLPSFGVVSHGPWYNGETRELFPGRCNPLFHRRGLRKSLAQCKPGCNGCRQSCDCGGGYESDIYQGPMDVLESSMTPSVTPANSYPLDSEATDSIKSKNESK